ncbi:MAG: hypothetical protein ACRDKE_07455 [Solirubrobacterales bacterium]
MAFILLDAHALWWSVTPAVAIKRAPAYAEVIPTLTIALLVESVWIMRSTETYFTAEDEKALPDARATLDVIVVLGLTVGFLFAVHGELAALASIGADPAQLSQLTAASPGWAVSAQFFILAIGLFARVWIVSDGSRRPVDDA